MPAQDIFFDATNTPPGDGTIGNPYADIQFGLDNWPGGHITGGSRLNIRGGTVASPIVYQLSQSINITTFTSGVGLSDGNPMIMVGYDTAVGDAIFHGPSRVGIPVIRGNGSAFGLWQANEALAHQHLSHLHFENFAQASNFDCQFNISILNCEIQDFNLVRFGFESRVWGCHFHNNAGALNPIGTPCNIVGNYVEDFGAAAGIIVSMARTRVMYNIVICDGTRNGINVTGGNNVHVHNNTIFCPALTNGIGTGLQLTPSDQMSVSGNAIQGFSGVGGVGINYNNTAQPLVFEGQNAINNCTQSIINPGIGNMLDLEDNEIDAWGGSMFKEAGAQTFENKEAFFEPIASPGNLVGGSSQGTWVTGYTKGHVQLNKGAVQSVT